VDVDIPLTIIGAKQVTEDTPESAETDETTHAPTTKDFYNAAMAAKGGGDGGHDQQGAVLNGDISPLPNNPSQGVPSGVLDDYLSDVELAQELDVSPRTIARWRAMREGPPLTRVGRRIMYRRSSVRLWLEGRERDLVAS
jgi:hypothetical protein